MSIKYAKEVMQIIKKLQMKNFNLFKDLIILDIANNHFGDTKHCKNIINQYSKTIKKNKLKVCF